MQGPLIFAGLSALGFGVADFTGGFVGKRTPVFSVMVYSQLIGMAVALAAALLWNSGAPALHGLLWGAVAGIGGAVGLTALYHGLATTIVAVVSPVAAVAGAVLPVVVGLAAGEDPGVLAGWGILLGLAAIVLVSFTPHPGGDPDPGVRRALIRKALLLGVIAGLSFGVFFIAFDRASSGAGLWPLVSARVASISLITGAAWILKKRLTVAAGSWFWIAVAGALDMAANLFFLLASVGGQLSITAVITSLYPVPTVLLAWVVFRERLTFARILGLFAAVGAISMISLGTGL
ncbi:MAG: DMT family transporter [Spirochaetales bacterium]|nr:DMT family transporter [Spirochaetales bacterium]MCF7939181.1 DMT family transporter [Spirochaetales bacterium]